MSERSELAQRAEREVLGLHAFFEQWFRGELDDTDALFARVARALQSGFQMVPPNGSRVDRAAILEAIRGAHGARGPGFAIRIEAFEVIREAGSHVLVTYEEHQDDTDRGEHTVRVSTVLFLRDPEAPQGVVWRWLQETWLTETRGPES